MSSRLTAAPPPSLSTSFLSRAPERFLAESERAETATEMETILGFYCRTRGAEYTQTLGWAELLAPLALLPLSRGDRYSCFYAIMSKYAFRDCVAGRWVSRPV